MTLVNVSSLATLPLFDPLRPILTRIAGSALPSIEDINTLIAGAGAPVLSGAGQPIRFVTATESAPGYEAGIYEYGRVPTRADSWHDLFNALVWLRFPRTKAALNARHMRGLATQHAAADPARGPVRDAATLFDESGVIVVSADSQLWDLLRDHEWRQLFWQQRKRVIRHMRFYVFGHAVYDQLRAPFFGLCAKAVCVDAADEFLGRSLDQQLCEIDAALAGRWSSSHWYPRPRDLAALPLLGIPGVTPDSECAEYYDDTRQFRPRRRA